jgi:hypothetical protein
MFRRVALIVGIVLVACAHPAFGCSCSNDRPIQSTSDWYRDRAVFTAHVIQVVGRIYDFKNEPRRMSSQALAVVKDRYWGLPWYWPKVVLLDGSYPCDIAMAEGEDYLVSGRRVRYGVLDVRGCSRTQLLKSAQIDLRTLGGSHCAGPGGTIIGHVTRDRDSVPGVLLRFQNRDGRVYTAKSDADGIYELSHLPPGPYTLESDLGDHEYASRSWYSLSTSSSVAVRDGLCGETDVFLKKYDFSGRLLPGLGEKVTVKLVPVDTKSNEVRSNSLEPDGRFYFSNVPDNVYSLAFTSSIPGAVNFYYPSTYDRKKATPIRVKNHLLAAGGYLDFNPGALPLVPILVTPDAPVNSRRFSWDIELVSSNYINDSEQWNAIDSDVRLYGVRGGAYKVQLLGFSNQPAAYDNCVSEPADITAQPGLVVHIKVPASCR